jgi:hypothetical protein
MVTFNQVVRIETADGTVLYRVLAVSVKAYVFLARLREPRKGNCKPCGNKPISIQMLWADLEQLMAEGTAKVVELIAPARYR